MGGEFPVAKPDDTLTAPLVTKRGPGRPVKHGLYSKFALVPLTAEKERFVIELVSGRSLAVVPSDKIMISLLARILAQIELMGRWLGAHGYFQDDATGGSKGAVTPILAQYTNAINVASKLCDKLGLSPEARVKLGKGVMQSEDLAAKIQRVRDE